MVWATAVMVDREEQRSSLREILAHVPGGLVASAVPDVAITGISIDSRRVEPGFLFVALRGRSTDGHDFIAEAISRGAAAVAGEIELRQAPAAYVRLRDAREALSWISAAFFGWPGRRLCVIGVTGTDGKTTTTNLIHRILVEADLRAGLISSVNAVVGDQVLDTGFHVTTPDAHDVQRYMERMVLAGVTHAVLETTSHGWAQHRVDACEFDIGVLTNITHEHLDEHGSFENYRAAKARLFAGLHATSEKTRGNRRLAVLNHDDPSYAFLQKVSTGDTLSYGIGPGADLRAREIQETRLGTRFAIEGRGLRMAVTTSLTGIHNVSNCLAAIGATIVGLDLSPDVAERAILRFQGVPGRMERIEIGQEFQAVVDFAHTPNALRATLETARRLVRAQAAAGRVIVIFGSAGLRDRAKRRMMAEIAAELADLTVLTAEDPRTESLEVILADMAEGARHKGGREGETFWRIPDRAEAIRFGLQRARAGDIVLACGKGHEQSMCFGSTEHPWDDRTAMRAALSERLGVPGPRMPYLPTQDQTEADWLA